MEDQSGQDTPNSPPTQARERNEPVRTRWTPKPEQILILESIFNSGMVNPPKEETVRIRKLLEKFGSVGDANVFYWFQNRRSRSRRRQRQIQAGLAGDQPRSAGGVIQFNYESGGGRGGSCSATTTAGFLDSQFLGLCPSSCLDGSSSSSSSGLAGGSNGGVDDFFSFSSEMGLPGIEESSSMGSILCSSDATNLHYQSGGGGVITVFINGVPTEVPVGSIDMKGMFGTDVVLVHSSGIPVPFNDYGFTLQSLNHGESYFLVSRPT